MTSLLQINHLKTYIYTDDGVVKAVNDVNLEVDKGETLCLVGESGCGKSVTALSIMRLIPEPSGKIISGEVIFKGVNLLALEEKQLRKIRGNKISIIFQNPVTSLNPVLRVGSQIAETIIHHKKMSGQNAMKQAVQMLKAVHIPFPEKNSAETPHQLSGGM